MKIQKGNTLTASAFRSFLIRQLKPLCRISLFYGPVEEIRIANEEKALMALVPPAQLKALNAGRTRQVAGDSQIMVSSYAASVDCDTPEYSAFFLSVVVPPDKVVAIRSVGTETGC